MLELRKNRAMRGAGMVVLYGALILVAVWLGCSRDTTPPGSPDGLNRTTAIDDKTPTFTWEAAADDGSGVADYLVRMDEGAWTNLGNTSTCDWGSPLSDGSHRFEVRAVDKQGNEGVSANLTFLVDTALPPKTWLISPANGFCTSDTTPSFEWGEVSDASGITYRLQIDDNDNFSSPCVNVQVVGKPQYTLTQYLALVDGDYYWRVRTVDGVGQESEWAEGRSLTVDTATPPMPILEYPGDGESTTDSTPWLNWMDVTDVGGVRYEVQVDDNADFSSPEIIKDVNTSSTTIGIPLADAVYYWRVRAVDGAGNASAWTDSWSLIIAAA